MCERAKCPLKDKEPMIIKRQWLYHRDMPKGKIFEDEEIAEKISTGWYDRYNSPPKPKPEPPKPKDPPKPKGKLKDDS